MSYFPADMPRPEPDMDDKAFWESCAEKRLCFQGCADCGTLRHPPTPICYVCHSVNVKMVEAPEEAEVFTYNVIRHASHAAVTGSLPYIGAVVEFAGMPGVRLITNVTDIDPAEMKIGMRVRLWWDDIGENMALPRFRP